MQVNGRPLAAHLVLVDVELHVAVPVFKAGAISRIQDNRIDMGVKDLYVVHQAATFMVVQWQWQWQRQPKLCNPGYHYAGRRGGVGWWSSH